MLAHALVLLSVGCSDKVQNRSDSAPPAGFADAERVIVLVLDGVRLEEGLGENTTSIFGTPTNALYPAIRTDLLPEGARVLSGHTTGATVTAPGHAELLSGKRLNYINISTIDTEHYRSTIPLIFDQLAADRGLSEDQTLLVANTSHLKGMEHSASPVTADAPGATYTVLLGEDGQLLSNDGLVIVEIEKYIESHDTHFLLANLHEVDRSGHTNSVDEYLQGVEALDEPIVGLWNTIQSLPGYADHTTLVLVSDHGRHSREDLWAGHGDQCRGCREVSMFFIGPDIKANVTSEETYVLADVAETIAWILDIDLPNGSGQVMDDLLVEPPGLPIRRGDVFPAQDNGVMAYQMWGADSDHRSHIMVGDFSISDPTAFHSEEPQIVVSDGIVSVCWRALPSWDEGDDFIVWEMRCMRGDGQTWTDISPPWTEEDTDAYWRPALGTLGDGLWLVDTVSPSSSTAKAHKLRLLRWREDAWEVLETSIDPKFYPKTPAMLLTSGDIFIAFANSDSGQPRLSRGVQLYRAAITDGEPRDWRHILRTRPSAADTNQSTAILSLPDDMFRAELPSIAMHNDTLMVSFVGHYQDRSSAVVIATSDDNGQTWGEPSIVDNEGEVLPHIKPQWRDDGAVVWARNAAAGTVEICAGSEQQTSCTATDFTAIAGLTVDGETVLASLWRPGERWQITEITL